MDDPRDDVATLCANLAMLRRHAPEDAKALVDQVHAGQPIGETLHRLLNRLDAPEPPAPSRDSSDVVNNLATTALLGRFGRHSAHEVYVCPADHCSRVVTRKPGTHPPTCHLDDRRLRVSKI